MLSRTLRKLCPEIPITPIYRPAVFFRLVPYVFTCIGVFMTFCQLLKVARNMNVLKKMLILVVRLDTLARPNYCNETLDAFRPIFNSIFFVRYIGLRRIIATEPQHVFILRKRIDIGLFCVAYPTFRICEFAFSVV